MTQSESRKPSILIIEDEIAVGKVCSRVLEFEGYAVTLVTNGLEAKNEVQLKHFDACLTDIRLPVINGLDFYEFLAKQYPALAQKTIFMTGDIMGKDINKFFDEISIPYLLKPFTSLQLIAAIKRLLK